MTHAKLLGRKVEAATWLLHVLEFARSTGKVTQPRIIPYQIILPTQQPWSDERANARRGNNAEAIPGEHEGG